MEPKKREIPAAADTNIAVNTGHMSDHISDEGLERYYLGMVLEEELARIEAHLLCCDSCTDRAEEAQDYVDAIRQAIILENYDLE